MLSIIVTHKKDLVYLNECLESIAEQNFNDKETILVLDHTEDDISELVEKYQSDINLKVFELTDKTGVSAARNYGLEMSTGEYFMFLDNDDFIGEGSLQAYMSMVDEDTDMVYGQVKRTRFKKQAYISGTADETKGEAEYLATLDFNDPINYCVERYPALQKLTILGSVYRRSLWDDNNIRFNDQQLYYSDAKVVAQIFSATDKIKGTEDALYVRRTHADKLNNPSINQIPQTDTMPYYFIAYNNAIKAATNERIKNHLNVVLAKFIYRSFPKKFRGAEDPRWREEYYDKLVEISQTIDKKAIHKTNIKGRNKRFVFSFMKGDKKKITKKIDRFLAAKKLKKIFKKNRSRYVTITLYIFNKLPFKKNWIVFESFMGRNYSGQPKYIYQYLQEHYGDKYKYIWVTDRKGIKIDGKHTKCKRWSLRYCYYLNRSKYWVFNMRQPLSIPRREGTILLETWHGTPLKRLAFDLEDTYSTVPSYKTDFYKQTRGWDYLLSDNPFSTEKFQKCFLVDKENILEYGYPANDPMYAPDIEERAANIKKKLGIDPNKKVIMYAPTWRDDNVIEKGQYGFELDLDINRMKKEFGDEYVLLLRLHYLVVDRFDMKQFGDFAVDVCNYDDVTELYLISDMLITDYSSVFFDYGNLKRPVLFYMYDLEKYRDVLHGFYLDIDKDLPGPIYRTNDEVIDAIKNIDKIQEEYKDRYEEFYNRFCQVDDGHASQRVVEKVFK